MVEILDEYIWLRSNSFTGGCEAKSRIKQMKSGDEVKKSRKCIKWRVRDQDYLDHHWEQGGKTDHLLLESVDYLYHFLATNGSDLR